MHHYPELRSASDGLKICFMQSEAVYHPYFKRMNKRKRMVIAFVHKIHLRNPINRAGNTLLTASQEIIFTA